MCVVGYKFRTFMQQNKTPNSSAHLACAIHMRDRRLFWSLWFWVWRYHIVVASHVVSLLEASHSFSDHALEISCSNIKSSLLWFHGFRLEPVGFLGSNHSQLPMSWKPYWVPSWLDTANLGWYHTDVSGEIALCACRSNHHSCLKFPMCSWWSPSCCLKPQVCCTLVI